MDGNLRNPNGSSSEKLGIIRESNSKDLVGKEEKGNLGVQMVESIPNKWTDEKHSLYLNSIEASFVKQLHNYDHRLKDSHGWLSRHKLLFPKSSPSNPNSHSSSGQFKVLRCGFWQKLNFDKAQTQLDTGNESCVISASPWIQHFRSASNGKGVEVTSLDLQENCEETQLGAQNNGATTCGLPTSSKKLPAFYSTIHHQDFVGSTTEVSDQNFVDESFGCGEGKNLISPCRKRRARTTVSDVSSKDQVVPFEKSQIKENPNENYASQRRKDESLEDRIRFCPTGFLNTDCTLIMLQMCIHTPLKRQQLVIADASLYYDEVLPYLSILHRTNDGSPRWLSSLITCKGRAGNGFPRRWLANSFKILLLLLGK
ncbi:cold-regulated protein 27-like [Tasmannia lanceolata]|uniref:cold-regulated protein 27-like n=1 Tax=Tasmannia lanceolata TaxID=3420 RepID=UPI004064668A